MADQRLRELERAWAESGAEQDHARLLVERLRAKTVLIKHLVVAALWGSEVAILVVNESDLKDWYGSGWELKSVLAERASRHTPVAISSRVLVKDFWHGLILLGPGEWRLTTLILYRAWLGLNQLSLIGCGCQDPEPGLVPDCVFCLGLGVAGVPTGPRVLPLVVEDAAKSLWSYSRDPGSGSDAIWDVMQYAVTVTTNPFTNMKELTWVRREHSEFIPEPAVLIPDLMLQHMVPRLLA